MHNFSDKPESDSENLLRTYLLGELSQEQQEQVEQRFLIDEDFFEEASILEEEIIDDFLNGTLAEREEFSRSFLSTPARREKVRIAMTVKRHLSEFEEQVRSESVDKPSIRSWFRIFRALRREPAHILERIQLLM